jgi:hypothetical protein
MGMRMFPLMELAIYDAATSAHIEISFVGLGIK